MSKTELRRSLTLPWLVFYGVGVTVGAGIFVLVGEVLGMAGDHALYAFMLAGLVAGITGFSYVLLASEYPKAAGEAVFVKHGMGPIPARFIGYMVVAVGITSASVIALAFARYLESLISIPVQFNLIGVVVVLALIAMMGVRESVGFAALITVLEVGTLAVVAIAGWPHLLENGALTRVLLPPDSLAGWSAASAGAFLAFFAFIGFEDIENMAEETQNAERNVPLAIIFTLVISLVLYGFLAMIAASFPDRETLSKSATPLVVLFEQGSGRDGSIIAAMATIAMINGILVQIMMASRVIYGMAREKLLPSKLGEVHDTRQTPVLAIVLVAVAVLILALAVPLLQLAELTSLVMLFIFATVNASLYLIGRRKTAPPRLRRWRWWGVIGAVVALALVVAQTVA
jgi:basic amino acid/polyamine antiporter, APA family